MFQQIRDKGGHLVILISAKNTNLVEDVAILLPVKICRIPFSGFKGEVENISDNQRLGRSSYTFQQIRDKGGHLVFLISLKNTNLVEDVETLLPVKFR